MGREEGESRQLKYLEVREAIERRIERGYYKVGTALPSEHELAAEFSTTRMTVRNAMDALISSGKLRRIKGKGSYVNALENRVHANVGFREMVRNANAEPSVRILSKSCRAAGPLYGRIFGIGSSEPLFCVRRLNCADGIPVSIERTVIPLSLFPGIEKRDVAAFSLYETYAMYGHEVVGAQEVLGVTRLGQRDANLLQVEAGHPVMTLDCLRVDAQGQPVECVAALTLGDRSTYSYIY